MNYLKQVEMKLFIKTLSFGKFMINVKKTFSLYETKEYIYNHIQNNQGGIEGYGIPLHQTFIHNNNTFFVDDDNMMLEDTDIKDGDTLIVLLSPLPEFKPSKPKNEKEMKEIILDQKMRKARAELVEEHNP